MSASESELPPLISLQTNYVPGPMVYRDWTIFDSGTQRHIMNAPESFVDFQPFQSQHFVLHGDTYTPVLGQGTTRIIATGPEGEVGCVMHDVLFIPGFIANIVSMDIIKSKGYIWDHEIDWVICCRTRKPMWKIHHEHGQNFISRKEPIPAPSIPVSLQATLVQLNSTGNNEKEQPEIDTPSYLHDAQLRGSPTHGGQDTPINIHHQQRRAISPPQVVTPPDSLMPTPDPTPTLERQRLDEQTGGHLYDTSDGLGYANGGYTIPTTTNYLSFMYQRSSS